MREIVALTNRDDFQTLMIKALYRKQSLRPFRIIEIDSLCTTGFMSWCLHHDKPLQIPDNCGEIIDWSRVGLIWLRRLRLPQLNSDYVENCGDGDFINRSCYLGLMGSIEDVFSGIWLNAINETRYAVSKVQQLRLATNIGFNVPRTVISNNPASITSFATEHNYNIVAKPIVQPYHKAYHTIRIDQENLQSYLPALHNCPTIFQELIPGNRHLRINCFGNHILPFEIISETLDWRGTGQRYIRVISISNELEQMILVLLKKLNIRMGIVDMKQSSIDEKIYFLEINPQGQFVFCEGLTGCDVSGAFISFLEAEIGSS